MGTILRTVLAEEDLLDIWAHIAEDNPDAADRLLDQLALTAETLAENPRAGRLRDELAPALRSLPVGNYVIFYEPIKDGIVIVRVLHGARDLPGLL
jgi:toxin ParE1/3/4